MNKFISLLACINSVIVCVEFLVLSRRSRNVLCWGNHLSAGCADMLRHSFFWKGHSDLYLPFHLARCWRRGWTVQHIDSSGFAFPMEGFIKWRGPVYSSWLVLRLESVVVRGGMPSFPTVKCSHVYEWWWDGRWVKWLRWQGAIVFVMLGRVLLVYRYRC